jgi:hypothetical protein
MPDLKISQDLFLGREELERLKSSLREHGFQFLLKTLTEKYGVIYNKSLDPSFVFLRVEAGNVNNTLRIRAGYAYDSDGLIITRTDEDSLINTIANDVWMWVKISYQTSNTEPGLVSIGGPNKDLMTGIGTKFTQVLRGQPNYPSKIRFLNSTKYNLEYQVGKVIDDEQVTIQGVFDLIETNLQYVVVGTFTPGHYPLPAEKDIYLYDSCKVDLIPESNENTPPTLQSGKEFLLARFKNSVSDGLVIQDRRSEYLFKSRVENIFTEVSAVNPMMGIESIAKFNNRGLVYYMINFDWKFRIGSETRNYQLNLLSISSGSGGAYATTADFQNGAFDGWNYYYIDGTFSRVLKSSRNNNNIDLYIDDIKEDVTGVCIAPQCTEVEVIALIKNSTSVH